MQSKNNHRTRRIPGDDHYRDRDSKRPARARIGARHETLMTFAAAGGVAPDALTNALKANRVSAGELEVLARALARATAPELRALAREERLSARTLARAVRRAGTCDPTVSAWVTTLAGAPAKTQSSARGADARSRSENAE